MVTTFGKRHSPPVRQDEFSSLNTTMRAYFAVLSFPISANLGWQLITNLTWWKNHELCDMCLHDAPFLGETRSIHLHVPLQCPYYTGFVPGRCLWALAEETGSQGSSSMVRADTQQSKSSPCIPPEQHGGYTLLYPLQWHWLKTHVACNPDVYSFMLVIQVKGCN